MNVLPFSAQVMLFIVTPAELPMQEEKSVSFCPVQPSVIWDIEEISAFLTQREANELSARYSVFEYAGWSCPPMLTMSEPVPAIIEMFERLSAEPVKLWVKFMTGEEPE
ncbi:Uncharacterised protein [uncultured archaeon]|nr:Uncharacterised protein [uncultured archaeon]